MKGMPRGKNAPDNFGEIDIEQLKKETEQMQVLNFLTAENSLFSPTDGGFVSLKTGDTTYNRVGFYRTFPFTDPNRFISVREADDKAREIGIIESLDIFDESTGKIIMEQLDIRYFTPKIVKINDIKDQYGFAYFDVVTDKGAAKFTIRNGGSAVVNLSETRLLISDIDGNRFEISDLSALSAGEIKKLDLFI